ncbi:SGNH/GDSL hydrolase family protein [Curtobacterium sp. B18]|uniref:SGNH/GDSL hydrolase family protein n=1 Tax=Curtobacterium sp. B18 TaxID=95614 RepID=UPI000349980A|nr:SGNH/GDSL hydrolase family protein [Curtobacterium sp. B18]
MPPIVRRVLAAGTAVVAALVLTACSPDVTTMVALAGTDGVPSRVVVIGDSITRGHGLAASLAWPELIATRDHLRLTDLGCDGAGVLVEGDDQCAATYDELLDRAAALDPAVVVLQASSNDLGQDDDALDGATAQLVADAHRTMPRARIVGLSAIWSDEAPPAQLAAVSAALGSAVRRTGGAFVDVGQPLRGHADWMQSDDVHPTARGQRAIAAAVTAALGRDHVRL